MENFRISSATTAVFQVHKGIVQGNDEPIFGQFPQNTGGRSADGKTKLGAAVVARRGPRAVPALASITYRQLSSCLEIEDVGRVERSLVGAVKVVRHLPGADGKNAPWSVIAFLAIPGKQGDTRHKQNKREKADEEHNDRSVE